MNRAKLDIIRILLKNQLEITLSEEEQSSLEDVDPEIRGVIESLLNDSAYLEEVDRLLRAIMDEVRHQPEEVVNYVRMRCESKHNQLVNPPAKYKFSRKN